jgi:hypothetical protein
MKQNVIIMTAMLATSIQVGNAFTSPLVKSPQRTSFRPLDMNHLSAAINCHYKTTQLTSSTLRMTPPVLEEEKVKSDIGNSSTRTRYRDDDDDDDDTSVFNIEDYDPSMFMGPIDLAPSQESGDVTTAITEKSKEDDKTLDIGEILGLAAWMGALSSFLLVNNFAGPFPANIATAVPVKTWGLMHGVGGMLFGGGIILTTCIEWLVTNSKNKSVWNFWFKKVPDLDSKIVLPALTASIVSGTALSVDHYNSLSQAPFHVTAALGTLLAFAGWWGITDLTTQGRATDKIAEITENAQDSDELRIPGILEFRKFSNLVSCGFVAALYFIMITKPGFTA